MKILHRNEKESKTDLEGKVFECIGDAVLGFKSAASLDKDRHGRRGLVVVHCGDLYTSRVDRRSE